MSAQLNPIINALVNARLQKNKISPENFVLDTLDLAYQVQDQVIQTYCDQTNQKQIGWKIALTGPMAQKKYGISQPVYGQLLDEMHFEKNASIQLADDDAVKLEVELVFVLKHDLVCEQNYDDQQLLAAVGVVIPALEIVNVRWTDWNFDLGNFLADNAAAQAYVLGDPIVYDYKLESLNTLIEESNFDSTLTVNLDDHPVKNFIWLVRALLNKGQMLRKGQKILTGSLIRPIGVTSGRYQINIAGQVLTLHAQ